MNPLALFKGAVSLATSVGIGAIVENAIKTTTPIGIGKTSKFFILVGSLVLTGMISTKVSKYAEDVIDGTVETVKRVVIR